MKNKLETNRIGYFPKQEPSSLSVKQHHGNPSSEAAEKNTARDDQSTRKVNQKTFFIVRIILILICSTIFAFCMVKLIGYFSDIAKSKSASHEITNEYRTSQELEPPVPTEAQQPPILSEDHLDNFAQKNDITQLPSSAEKEASPLWPQTYANNLSLRISATFYQLQQKNPDIVAWLEIPGLVQEAVVLKNNQYYLTHNLLKEKSVTGALFLDESTDLSKPPIQYIVHGHNMKEGSMFGSLKKYKVKDSKFYHSNALVTFNTQYENGEYVIFAVCETSINPSSSRYLPFWVHTNFQSAVEFDNYVKKIRDLSHFHSPIDVEAGDRLLLLSTCLGSDEEARLVVVARRIRSNEDRTELNMKIMATTDR